MPAGGPVGGGGGLDYRQVLSRMQTMEDDASSMCQRAGYMSRVRRTHLRNSTSSSHRAWLAQSMRSLEQRGAGHAPASPPSATAAFEHCSDSSSSSPGSSEASLSPAAGGGRLAAAWNLRSCSPDGRLRLREPPAEITGGSSGGSGRLAEREALPGLRNARVRSAEAFLPSAAAQAPPSPRQNRKPAGPVPELYCAECEVSLTQSRRADLGRRYLRFIRASALETAVTRRQCLQQTQLTEKAMQMLSAASEEMRRLQALFGELEAEKAALKREAEAARELRSQVSKRHAAMSWPCTSPARLARQRLQRPEDAPEGPLDTELGMLIALDECREAAELEVQRLGLELEDTERRGGRLLSARNAQEEELRDTAARMRLDNARLAADLQEARAERDRLERLADESQEEARRCQAQLCKLAEDAAAAEKALRESVQERHELSEKYQAALFERDSAREHLRDARLQAALPAPLPVVRVGQGGDTAEPPHRTSGDAVVGCKDEPAEEGVGAAALQEPRMLPLRAPQHPSSWARSAPAGDSGGRAEARGAPGLSELRSLLGEAGGAWPSGRVSPTTANGAQLQGPARSSSPDPPEFVIRLLDDGGDDSDSELPPARSARLAAAVAAAPPPPWESLPEELTMSQRPAGQFQSPGWRVSVRHPSQLTANLTPADCLGSTLKDLRMAQHPGSRQGAESFTDMLARLDAAYQDTGAEGELTGAEGEESGL